MIGGEFYTFTGPSSGLVNAASGNFTVTPNESYNGTISFHIMGGGYNSILYPGQVITKTFSNSSASQTFTITPTAAQYVTLTPINDGGLANPPSLIYVASSGSATTFNVYGPYKGAVNTNSVLFTVVPDGIYGTSGTPKTITITPTGTTGLTPVVLTFAGSSSPQTFTITPTSTGLITLTPSNNGSLTLPSAITYLSYAVGYATTYTLLGPSSGLVNTTSTNFTVTLDNPPTGTITVTVTPSGGGLSTPIPLEFSGSTTSQTFTIHPTSVGLVTLAATNDGDLIDPPDMLYGSQSLENIDSSWTTYPFQLTSNDTYYKLQRDVTAPLHAIMMGANNITLDLNGYTVAYDTSSPLTLTNGSFETGDFTGWVVTGTGSASVVSQTYSFWGSWMAKLDVTSGQNITLTSSTVSIPTAAIGYIASVPPLTKTPDNITVTVNVLDAVSGQVLNDGGGSFSPLTVTPNGSSMAAGGIINIPFLSTATMVTNGVKVQIVVSFVSGVTTGTLYVDGIQISRCGTYPSFDAYTDISGIGFYYNKSNVSITSSQNYTTAASCTATISGGSVTGFTGLSGGSGYRVSSSTIPVAIYGGDGFGASATATSNSSGVITSVTLISGGTYYTSAPTVVIGMGKITQGQGNATEAHCIIGNKDTANVTLNNVELNCYGQDTMGAFFSGHDLTVTNNIFTMGLTRISNRQAAFAMIQAACDGKLIIQNNMFFGGHQNGIVIPGWSNWTSPVYDQISITGNTIKQHSEWTDGYAIGPGGINNFEIANNTIIPASGRGIMLQSQGPSDGFPLKDIFNGTIHDNYIEVQEHPSAEYGATGLEATALRIRNYGGSSRNVEIYNNTLYAHTGSGLDWAAIGCRMSLFNHIGQMNNCNVDFHDNTFKAVILSDDSSLNYQDAYAVDFAEIDAGTGITLYNNTFESNHTSLNFGSDDGKNECDVTIIKSTLTKSSLGVTTLKPSDGVRTTYTPIDAGGFASLISNVNIIDLTYENGASPGFTLYSTNPKDLKFGWLLNLTVTQPPGTTAAVNASVTVTDGSGVIQFAGTTDSNGQCLEIPLITDEYSSISEAHNTTPTHSDYNQFSVYASLGSYSGTTMVTMDMTKNVSLAIS